MARFGEGNQRFSLLYFGWALLDEARIWRGFGFGLEKTWISFIPLAAPAFPVLAHGGLPRWLRRRDASIKVVD